MQNSLKKIVEDFGYKCLKADPFGSGHINDTYRITTDEGFVILQKINTSIFKQPDELMSNITKVTNYLESIGKPTYKVLGYKNSWRLLTFIDNAYTVDVLSSPDQAYTAGAAFGAFQNDLAAFDANDLVESIPNFHNTPWRLEQLDKVFASDKLGRAAKVAKQMDFVNNFRDDASRLIDLMNQGKIPVRITHNDTKINNVMLDKDTNKAIAVIDLDTVMPGCALYDFGDMVRTATASAQEDEKDTSKMFSRVEYFEKLAQGYLSQAKFLNDYELDNLVFSGMLITFTIGVRFLTDYLDGDNYFKTAYEEHNLVRAKTQFKLVESIQKQYDPFNQIIYNIVKEN